MPSRCAPVSHCLLVAYNVAEFGLLPGDSCRVAGARTKIGCRAAPDRHSNRSCARGRGRHCARAPAARERQRAAPVVALTPMTRRLATWLLPAVLALHNLEEGLLFPRYLPRVLGRLPAGIRDWIGPVSSGEMWLALALATGIPLAFSVWAAVRPASRAALWLVLAMWATLLLNAVWHVVAAAGAPRWVCAWIGYCRRPEPAGVSAGASTRGGRTVVQPPGPARPGSSRNRVPPSGSAGPDAVGPGPKRGPLTSASAPPVSMTLTHALCQARGWVE